MKAIDILYMRAEILNSVRDDGDNERLARRKRELQAQIDRELAKASARRAA